MNNSKENDIFNSVCDIDFQSLYLPIILSNSVIYIDTDNVIEEKKKTLEVHNYD